MNCNVGNIMGFSDPADLQSRVTEKEAAEAKRKKRKRKLLEQQKKEEKKRWKIVTMEQLKNKKTIGIILAAGGLGLAGIFLFKFMRKK